MDEQAMSGNNLWSLLVNFLTVTPERDAGKHKHKHKHKHGHGHLHERKEHHDTQPGLEKAAAEKGGTQAPGEDVHKSRRERFVSRFAKLVADRRKSRGARQAASGSAEQ
ncbi:hypothetical protein NUW54_g12931 [Trametes sanguinea]|uniref:Uncharacterized protein n=1 Tax=Trametes sanguinea TaxID=158606 RepID=A0ACC1MT98_9APHY|nr:hypothetical protein NUW54_g12931 [Trametes sanguinea]